MAGPILAFASPAGLAAMKMRPVAASSVSPRFIPPAKAPCRTADISLRVVATAPPDRQGVASVALTSERACRLGGRQSVTPRRSNGRAAAAPVVLGGARNDRAVTVSPGHGASVSIRFFFDPVCLVDNHTPATIIATAFSYDLNGARGTFALPAPVAACPMSATIESSDIYTKGDVEVAGPAKVKAGGRYDGHVDFHYLDTADAVLEPCPTIWARISPQSGPDLDQSWLLECHGMRPVSYGDHFRVGLTLIIPAGLASQAVDISAGFGLPTPSTPGSPMLTGSQRIWVTGDHPLQPVPFQDVAARPTTALRRTTSPPVMSPTWRPPTCTGDPMAPPATSTTRSPSSTWPPTPAPCSATPRCASAFPASQS